MSDQFLDLVRSGDFVALDTETTGLYYPSEIVQIAIVDSQGGTLIDTLVKPLKGIPIEATRVHGITPEMVASAPSWIEVGPQVMKILEYRNVVIYNAQYDLKLLDWSSKVYGVTFTPFYGVCTTHCAMLWYADYYGEYDEFHGNNRWQTLSKAIRQQGLSEMGTHSAIGDALMTLQLIKHIAAKEA